MCRSWRAHADARSRGALTGPSFVVPAAHVATIQTLVLNRIVPAGQTVRWQTTACSDASLSQSGLTLTLDVATAAAATSPKSARTVTWVSGQERLELFAYDPDTATFTETQPGLASGRANRTLAAGVLAITIAGPEVLRVTTDGLLHTAALIAGGRHSTVEETAHGGEIHGLARGALVNLAENLAEVNFRQTAFPVLSGGFFSASKISRALSRSRWLVDLNERLPSAFRNAPEKKGDLPRRSVCKLAIASHNNSHKNAQTKPYRQMQNSSVNMKNSLAVRSWSLQPTSPQDLITKLSEIGVRRVQLALDPLRDEPAVWGKTPQLFQQAGITIVSGMFGCVGEDYSTLETIRVTGGIVPDSTWEQNRRNIQTTVALTQRLGLKLVTFHAGFLPHDTHRKAFFKFIDGIGEVADREWYASVMLNRLMFLYFIQRKGFRDGDHAYLRNRLARCQKEQGKDKFHTFYRYFLLRRFHEGFGKRRKHRAPDLEKPLGSIP